MRTSPDQPPQTDPADEETTALLLRIAGPRPAVPGTRAARVRTAVHEHWHASAHRRAARKRALVAAGLLATAATLALAVGRFMMSGPTTVPLGEAVAIVEHVGDPASHLRPGDSIRTGEWIETTAGARLSIRIDGASVRFDGASRARPLAAHVIELSAGALYIDTRTDSAQFEVRTAWATARDIGTQFEVRLQDDAVRVRVRSGMVELTDGARSVAADAGTEVTMSATGAVSRPIALHGPEWDWTAGLAPELDIEGMALSEFLDRISREHGWRLQYGDAALAREASSIILHGSVAGLQPREALDVAITTSGLAYRLDDGILVVTKRAAR